MTGTSDRRLYARLTLDFADSPKIAPLSDRAFRELIEALLWSRRLMTDGRIPKRMIGVLFSPDALVELTTNDERPSLVFDGDDVVIHDFAEHQSTREQIEQYSAAGRKGAAARYASRKASSSDDAEPHANRKRTASESNSQTETEAETTTGPRKRGTRITESFVVDDALREYAKSKAPAVNVDREREQFVNYWLSASGRSAVKADWRRAFMTWLVKAQGWAEERGWQASSAAPVNESQSKMTAWLTARGISLDEWERRKHDSEWVESLRGANA